MGYLKMNIAELCNGSTYDSDSYCLGSNPSSAAKAKAPERALFALAAELGFETSDKQTPPYGRLPRGGFRIAKKAQNRFSAVVGNGKYISVTTTRLCLLNLKRASNLCYTIENIVSEN